MTVPLRVGVSSCLLGEQVRWDGDHRRHDFLVRVLGPFVEWIPVCPEVEIGLGVPRGPIQLLRTAAGMELWARDSRRDLTRTLTDWAAGRLDELAPLDGWVLKHRSPSCGLTGARVYRHKAELFGDGDFDRTGRGLWAAALLACFPDLPVVEEHELDDPASQRSFVAGMLSVRRKRSPDLDPESARELLCRIGSGSESA